MLKSMLKTITNKVGKQRYDRMTGTPIAPPLPITESIKGTNIGSYSRFHLDTKIAYSVYITVCSTWLIFLISEKEIFINGCMFII